VPVRESGDAADFLREATAHKSDVTVVDVQTTSPPSLMQ
jgi:hypothetical protein